MGQTFTILCPAMVKPATVKPSTMNVLFARSVSKSSLESMMYEIGQSLHTELAYSCDVSLGTTLDGQFMVTTVCKSECLKAFDIVLRYTTIYFWQSGNPLYVSWTTDEPPTIE
jgi:hypothetical protein